MNNDNDSPLRAFLRSIQSSISSYDLNLLAPSPLPESRNNISENEGERNAMLYARDENQYSLSFGLEKIALGEKPRDRNISSGVPSVGNGPDVFIRNSICQQQSLMHMSGPTLPREIFLNVKPTPLMASSVTKKKRRQKGNSNVQSKKEEVSFYTLNKLMERTASSRCLLLQQRKTSNESSTSLMKSLYATIVSSTKITSSTSATSFRNATAVSDTTFTTSDLINSYFDKASEYSQQKAKKRRIASSIDHNLFASKLKPSKTFEELKQTSVTGVKQSATLSMTSLPSCGSLTKSSSESESSFQQVIQNPSSSAPVEINEAIQVTPLSENDIVRGGAIRLNGCSSRVYSSGSLVSSSSLASEQNFKQQKIQGLSSSSGLGMAGSFQSIRKFNSYEAPVGKNDHSTCRPTHVFSGGELPLMFQSHGKNSRDQASQKISHTMKHKLKRELEQLKTKIGSQECSSSTWLF